MTAKDFRQKAWGALKGKWGTMVLITLIYGVIVGAVGAIPTVGSIASLVITGPLTLGLAIAAINVIREKEVTVSTLFDGFKDFVNAFLLNLVNSIFIFLWTLLLFIPGFIKSYAYSMSYYILNDNPGMSQSEARKASIEMMKGHKWELFCLHFSFIGWWLLIIVTLGIASFWVGPYIQTANAAFYENLKKASEPTVSPETSEWLNQGAE